jgi:CMP-N-acetylneuraminic acid synthetase
MKPRIVALIPMRHHSQRVPGKNYRPLAGKPLYHHILLALMECKEIDQIVIDTDSPVILEDLRSNFLADVSKKESSTQKYTSAISGRISVIERPEHLRADHLPMNEILAYDTSQVEGDFYLQTHSTNPLLRASTISAAIQTLLDNIPTYDSLFSVTRLQTRLWDQLGRAINHNPAILLQTQDLPPVFEENSCMYIFTREKLLSRRNRLGERPMMFPIDAAEAWDIDEELDFQIVDLLLSNRSSGNSPQHHLQSDQS